MEPQDTHEQMTALMPSPNCPRCKGQGRLNRDPGIRGSKCGCVVLRYPCGHRADVPDPCTESEDGLVPIEYVQMITHKKPVRGADVLLVKLAKEVARTRGGTAHAPKLAIPEQFDLHNACTDRCDVLYGFCACGSYHDFEWFCRKVGNMLEVERTQHANLQALVNQLLDTVEDIKQSAANAIELRDKLP